MNGHASQVDQIEKAPEKPSRASFSRSWLVLELVTLALTGLFLYSFLIRQQYRDVPMETIISAVSEGEGLTAMINEDRAGLRRCYGLDAGATEGFYFCRSSSNMEADELLIVKAADEAAARALVPAAQARLDALHESFDHYGVSEVSKLNKAILAVRGQYLFFAVSDSAGDWEARFLREVSE